MIIEGLPVSKKMASGKRANPAKNPRERIMGHLGVRIERAR
jgi:hypothetical protein